MPTDPMFENPHRAYVTMLRERLRLQCASLANERQKKPCSQRRGNAAKGQRNDNAVEHSRVEGIEVRVEAGLDPVE